MGYRPHAPLSARLIGYDPVVDLPEDHLARFVDAVVEEALSVKPKQGRGQPAYDPRVPIKVLLFGMATGIRSSRRLALNCHESLPYLLLVREDRPCFRTLCTVRCQCKDLLEQIWVRLNTTAAECGIKHLGKIAIDSTKFRADTSRDSVVYAKHMDEVLARFRQILGEIEAADAREDEEGHNLHTQTGVPIRQMREILRKIRRKDSEKIVVDPKLKLRVKGAIGTLEGAKQAGLKQVSLTDPDARPMPIGSSKKIAMGHCFEAASDNGLLVVGQACNCSADNDRLGVVLAEAEKMDPVSVTQAAADSGYYSGGIVNQLLQRENLDVVVPDSMTASRMRKGEQAQADPIEFRRLPDRDAYVCPQGKLLKPEDRQQRGGQRFVTYIAQGSCLECPLACQCLKSPKAKRRNLTVGEFDERLKKHLKRFEDPQVRKDYHARGPAIETVFGFIRSVMGFQRWSLRGSKKVEAEASLLKVAYQIRKIHTAKLACKAA